MKSTVRWMSMWMALVVAGLCPVPERAAAVEAEAETGAWGGIKVERRTFPVRLSDGHVYNLVGYLYYQGSLKNKPVQILVHGITYNHDYWDLPEINRQDYSYARYMARQHYAVLALDLLGTGESDKPDGDFLDLSEAASSLHRWCSGSRRPRRATPSRRSSTWGTPTARSPSPTRRRTTGTPMRWCSPAGSTPTTRCPWGTRSSARC
ncbi:alpha/beta hydrolase [Cystobacter fuscus]